MQLKHWVKGSMSRCPVCGHFATNPSIDPTLWRVAGTIGEGVETRFKMMCNNCIKRGIVVSWDVILNPRTDKPARSYLRYPPCN